MIVLTPVEESKTANSGASLGFSFADWISSSRSQRPYSFLLSLTVKVGKLSTLALRQASTISGDPYLSSRRSHRRARPLVGSAELEARRDWAYFVDSGPRYLTSKSNSSCGEA